VEISAERITGSFVDELAIAEKAIDYDDCELAGSWQLILYV
jgi:hypothetical protein